MSAEQQIYAGVLLRNGCQGERENDEDQCAKLEQSVGGESVTGDVDVVVIGDSEQQLLDSIWGLFCVGTWVWDARMADRYFHKLPKQSPSCLCFHNPIGFNRGTITSKNRTRALFH